MAFNPSRSGEPLSVPTNSRKNSTNEPGFENQQGYYPYDLSHTEVIPSLYGLVTPSMHLITAMGDRHVVKDDTKTILNRINGNFLNTVNQYIDSFFVSNRTLFPSNWDKLIPNPVKGDDLPNSARPVVPLLEYIYALVADSYTYRLMSDEYALDEEVSPLQAMQTVVGFVGDDTFDFFSLGALERMQISFALANMTLCATIVSRGQLLDYLGVQFDSLNTSDYLSSFQYKIDRFFLKYADFVIRSKVPMVDYAITPTGVGIYFDNIMNVVSSSSRPSTLSEFRDRYMSALEHGKMIIPNLVSDSAFDEAIDDEDDSSTTSRLKSLLVALDDLYTAMDGIFNVSSISPEDLDLSDEFNKDGLFINISKALAYQMCIAQYYTNDSVDNIFTADLFMQLLRGVMYPSDGRYTTEPTFNYNGVPTEYDYISYGGFYYSLISNDADWMNSHLISRRYIFGTLMFLMRRSLRYGDYFTTGRTRMLAVGQLSVPTDDTDCVSVNPVDITIGLVTQRFLNAANRVGNKPLSYYASIMGVAPSDMPSIPRYVGHRKIEFENRITINTAEEQGNPSTNLVGYSDNMGFDVFIDDYGVLLSLNSYDCLPIYHSGVDADNFLSDRFEYFNPMMQNIGDQPIHTSELLGNTKLNYDKTFAYTVRNSEYKYKNSRAHGVLCYNMPGYLLKFPTELFSNFQNGEPIEHINPDFIRDKPAIFDAVITHSTGASFGDYFHFIVSVHNSVKSARLIQKAPGILF